MPQVPAPRYAIFIDFFEKKVTKAQQEIETIRTIEPFYNIARVALNKHNYPNDIKLDTNNKDVNIRIQLTEDNHHEDFLPLLQTLASLLVAGGHRQDPTWASGETDTFWIHHKFTVIKNKTHICTIDVTLDVPWCGTRYCSIREKPYTTTSSHRILIWHKEPEPEQEPQHTLVDEKAAK